MALAKFIIMQAGVTVTFPATLRREGGIRSYNHFSKVFNYSIPKIIKILGGKVSIGSEKDIVHCIALAMLLETDGNSILGTDLVPEYTNFNTDDWIDYLSNNRQKLTNDFRQQLSTFSDVVIGCNCFNDNHDGKNTAEFATVRVYFVRVSRGNVCTKGSRGCACAMLYNETSSAKLFFV